MAVAQSDARCWRESALLENGGQCSPQQLQFDFPSEKRLDGMIKGTKGTIVSIDNSLHNLDYHELGNAEGEAGP